MAREATGGSSFYRINVYNTDRQREREEEILPNLYDKKLYHFCPPRATLRAKINRAALDPHGLPEDQSKTVLHRKKESNKIQTSNQAKKQTKRKQGSERKSQKRQQRSLLDQRKKKDKRRQEKKRE